MYSPLEDAEEVRERVEVREKVEGGENSELFRTRYRRRLGRTPVVKHKEKFYNCAVKPELLIRWFGGGWK